MRLDSVIDFVGNSAFSPALDQRRQSLRIGDAKKAISKRVYWARKLLADKRCLDTLHW